MNSTDFSLLTNSSLEVDRNQISFGTIDFQTHPPNLTPVFESLDQEMDLTIDAGRITTQLGIPRGTYDDQSSKSFPQ
jgi:hypothetical protein